ncbi:MAG: DNA-3-methyladenine glycosylase [Pseudomonadota bacterium]
MTAALELLRSDPALAPVVERAGPYTLRPQPFEHVFEPLARSVVYQQLSGKAAATIHGRFVARFGSDDRPDPVAVASASHEALREVGLSRRKAEYVQGLAEAALAGDLPGRGALEALDDETVIERLTALRGIGRWTVEMLLIAWLARPDVLPVSDLGIRKGMAIIDGLEELPDPDAMIERAERWRPYRSTASWYLWRATES